MRATCALTLMLTVSALTAQVAPPALGEGWQALGRTRAEAALRVFLPQVNAAKTALAHEARFGRALALLLKQPASAAQVEEARGILAELAATGTGEWALGARYFLGRIAQHHLTVPDPTEAARQWRQLIGASRDSIWAQTALSRLALVEIYELCPAQPPAERIAMAAQLLPDARMPAAQSELHLALADAILHYRLPAAAALPHLVAAHQLSLLDGPTAADVTVQIAEISTLTGNTSQAQTYYRQFLENFPRDQRRYAVRQKLAALDRPAAGAAPTGR